ncbi:MAG: hypothetical protein ACYSU0_08850 [Planctomycetota bacterium]|jgi:hypothetical protein
MDESIAPRRSWRPATLLTALAANAAIWAAYFLWSLRDAYPLGWILGAIALCAVLGLTSVGIVVGHVVVGRREITPWLRYPAYAVPSALLVVVAVMIPKPPPEPNQVQRAPSPSGRYRLTMPIEDDRWRVTIHDTRGNLEYKDGQSELPGWFSVYWVWDDSDRVWLYNSDDGNVYFWENTGSGWRKHHWGYSKTRRIDRDVDPPLALYPDYVRPGPIKHLDTRWELAGFSRQTAPTVRTRVSLENLETGKSIRLEVGESAEGVEFLDANWERKEIRVRIGSRELTMTMGRD